jgi:hypothetical protein
LLYGCSPHQGTSRRLRRYAPSRKWLEVTSYRKALLARRKAPRAGLAFCAEPKGNAKLGTSGIDRWSQRASNGAADWIPSRSICSPVWLCFHAGIDSHASRYEGVWCPVCHSLAVTQRSRFDVRIVPGALPVKPQRGLPEKVSPTSLNSSRNGACPDAPIRHTRRTAVPPALLWNVLISDTGTD